MQLPARIRAIVEEFAESVPLAELRRASMALSGAYRERRGTAAIDVAAYLVTRMPATYAATYRVLQELRGLEIASILDIGAGTGAATLATRELFPAERMTLVEPHAPIAQAGRRLLPDAEWRAEWPGVSPHDLVIASYSLGEMRDPPGAAERLWNLAHTAFVAIEPGTPAGFQTILAVRQRLLAVGGRIAAPCPSDAACPLDWCHFAARVERSSLHRRVKGGDLGYEDEKYSYVAFVKGEPERPPARIVRHPRHQPGLITLELCEAPALRTARIRKSDREAFRAARKAQWGDRWHIGPDRALV